jgi:hypothetical protein
VRPGFAGAALLRGSAATAIPHRAARAASAPALRHSQCRIAFSAETSQRNTSLRSEGNTASARKAAGEK